MIPAGDLIDPIQLSRTLGEPGRDHPVGLGRRRAS